MSKKYRHLLSPLKIGNVVLKNRMLSSNALPHFLQGPESYPADPLISFVSGLAKNGAAVVTFATWANSKQRLSFNEDGRRFPMFDISDPSVENYLCHLVDAIHFYDSRASIAVRLEEPEGYGVCDSPGIKPPVGETDDMPLMMPGSGPCREITEELMNEMIEKNIKTIKYYKDVIGFDMLSIHMAYRGPLFARFLSPITNKRKDKYGGSIENRARLPLETCRRIKEACGRDFLIEAIISGEEAGGTTIEDTVAFAKLAEGKVDILQIRAGDGNLAHPTGFNSTEGSPGTLRVAEAIKKSGAKIVTAPIGGFQNLDENEEFIASGKTDMIAMGRAFICDPEYGVKAYEGRGEDVTPCIRCNKCHVPSMTGPWLSVCSVNPVLGFAHKIERMVDVPAKIKKVAVIGGGPAGMKAAIVAAGRGHKVTLYERDNVLGGQLIHADFSSFKWPLRNFKNYLIRQMYKSGVKVLLGTEATPEMLRKRSYDAVLAATGAEPDIVNIPGADRGNVWTPIRVYGNESKLGKKVVVVGGSEIGTETGMYLAETGHEVTVLTRQKKLATDATPVHYIEMFREAWEKLDNFSYITRAATTGISEGKVTYTDAEGNEKIVEADSVVICAGLTPRQDEALKFHDSADRLFLIGDCREVGNVQKCMRSAFAAASEL